MRIIKEGKIPFPIKIFKCFHCECEFEIDKYDIQYEPREGAYVICPCCKAWIDLSRGKNIYKNTEF